MTVGPDHVEPDHLMGPPAVPRVTALRHGGRASVEVWLDGGPWRSLHEDVVVRTGLAVGVALDRERARAVARERRRAAAMQSALGALRYRDHSAAGLRRRLEERGVTQSVSEDTVERLTAVGLVDDVRAAQARAALLAAREWGDDGIRADLAARGFPDEVSGEAIAGLEAEHERVTWIVARRGATAATARALARKGFSDGALDDLIASLGDSAIA